MTNSFCLQFAYDISISPSFLVVFVICLMTQLTVLHRLWEGFFFPLLIVLFILIIQIQHFSPRNCENNAEIRPYWWGKYCLLSNGLKFCSLFSLYLLILAIILSICNGFYLFIYLGWSYMFYLAFCDLRRHLHLYLFIHLSSSLQIWKLQAALSAQSEITKYSQQEYERLQTV